MISDTQREGAYTKTTAVQKQLYASPQAGKTLKGLAQKYNVHAPETYSIFAVTVGDIILGFYKPEDTITLLQQELGISTQTAALLSADLKIFLAPLQDPNWQAPQKIVSESEAVAEEIITADIALELAETEVAMRAIPALRTMSGNHEFTPESGEPVYSTTQSAIINESLHVPSQAAPLRSAPLAPTTPTTIAPAPGRWDSEPS